MHYHGIACSISFLLVYKSALGLKVVFLIDNNEYLNKYFENIINPLYNIVMASVLSHLGCLYVQTLISMSSKTRSCSDLAQEEQLTSNFNLKQFLKRIFEIAIAVAVAMFRKKLPQLATNDVFLTDGGLETHLVIRFYSDLRLIYTCGRFCIRLASTILQKSVLWNALA